MPEVSVIIPTYNCAHYLPEAVSSVLAQTYRDFEILVIDDGSTDTTRACVEPFVEKHAEYIRYFYQENKGLACARNTGLRYARGTYIALLDADDVWLPERLEKTVRLMDADARIGFVHANITRMDEQGNRLDTPKRNVPHLSGFIFEPLFLRSAHIACPTVLFRKSLSDNYGGFDPQLARLGCEDRELWLRFAPHAQFAYIDGVLALYRVSPDSMSRNKDKMMRARMYVVNKYAPAQRRQARTLRKRALSVIYRDLADEWRDAGCRQQARENYKKAIQYCPFDLRLWKHWIQAQLKIDKGV